MGEVASHDKATMGVDGVRLAADDGAARSIALLVLAVAMVALIAGLLLEGRPDPVPAVPDEPVSQRSAPAHAASSTAPARRPTSHDAAIAAHPVHQLLPNSSASTSSTPA